MSLLVIGIPGPSVLFVIGRALAHGRRTAPATVLGNVTGSYVLVVGVTNPKGIVFFAAVLPRFVDHSAGHLAAQMLLLGLVRIAIGTVTDMLWGLGASAARTWFAGSDRRLSMIGGAGGFAMIGLGVTVAATGRAD
ncbi:LysE family translocator [Streptomyces sp. NPDC060022]|uniref:LysE family translocator n=1 Tax=Streptomyces sp. NPDC060022 TaxID=3347039 RepID=UPI00369C76AB